jgi:hypothetical protein
MMTIISQHVTWWLIPIPVIFKFGFRHYIHDVAWECMRLQQPSYIFFRSCFQQERTHWQNAYYSGILKPPNFLGNVKALMRDSLLLVSTTLALYRLCSGGKADKDLSGINSSLWNYPSLPVAIYGLSVVIFSRTKLSLGLIFLIIILISTFIIIMISLAIGLTFNHGLWFGSAILVSVVAIPFWAINHRLNFITVVLSALSRVGGPIIGAVSPKAYFPFCQLRGWGFAGPLLALSIINIILAMYAISLAPRQERPEEIEEMKEMP